MKQYFSSGAVSRRRVEVVPVQRDCFPCLGSSSEHLSVSEGTSRSPRGARGTGSGRLNMRGHVSARLIVVGTTTAGESLKWH